MRHNMEIVNKKVQKQLYHVLGGANDSNGKDA